MIKKYGLIGFPLSHSFSQKYFTEKFRREGIVDHSYANFELKNLVDLKKIIQQNNLSGFNITIPHKQSIIPFLDEKDEVVEQIDACNCIKIVNDQWKGYNTDVYGFEKSFSSKLLPHHRNALILGTGGSAKAVQYVLQKLQINYLLVSTSKTGENIIEYDNINETLLNFFTILINTSPVGMFPDTATCLQLPYDFISEKHYFFDLVYNPEKTLFLKKGEAKGATIKNGSDMLVAQAEESWRIWNSG